MERFPTSWTLGCRWEQTRPWCWWSMRSFCEFAETLSASKQQNTNTNTKMKLSPEHLLSISLCRDGHLELFFTVSFAHESLGWIISLSSLNWDFLCCNKFLFVLRSLFSLFSSNILDQLTRTRTRCCWEDNDWTKRSSVSRSNRWSHKSLKFDLVWDQSKEKVFVELIHSF